MEETTKTDQLQTRDFPTTIPPLRRRPARSRDLSSEDETPADRPLRLLPVIQIANTAYRDMMEYITSRMPETAGVLIGPKNHDAVTHFVPDEAGDSSPASFTLGHLKLNEILAKYLPAGLDGKGIVHSHPAGCISPSSGDLAYVAKCFRVTRNGSLDRFLLPIVVGERFHPYVVFRDDPDNPQFAQVVLF